MLVTPLGLMSCEIVRLLDTKLQSAGTRTVVRTLPCGARPAPPPWIFSFNELSLHSAAAHRGKKVKKQIMELANIIRDFHLLSLLVCGGVVCGVWRAGPGSPDARLGNVNCKIIVRTFASTLSPLRATRPRPGPAGGGWACPARPYPIPQIKTDS